MQTDSVPPTLLHRVLPPKPYLRISEKHILRIVWHNFAGLHCLRSQISGMPRQDLSFDCLYRSQATFRLLHTEPVLQLNPISRVFSLLRVLQQTDNPMSAKHNRKYHRFPQRRSIPVPRDPR